MEQRGYGGGLLQRTWHPSNISLCPGTGASPYSFLLAYQDNFTSFLSLSSGHVVPSPPATMPEEVGCHAGGMKKVIHS